MLRKWFSPPRKPATRAGAFPQRALAQIVLEPPAFQWAAVVSVSGRLEALFPDDPAVRERIAAMSAALLSLGERIARELGDGPLEYALIAGQQGKTLAFVLDGEHLLAAGLGQDGEIAVALAKVARQCQAWGRMGGETGSAGDER